MRIWRAVRGEGSELGSSSRARGTPLAQGEGSELGIGPDPKAPQRMLIVGQQPNRLRDPPKGGRGSCWSKHCCGSEEIEGGGGGGEGEGMEGKASCWSEHCCGSEEI